MSSIYHNYFDYPGWQSHRDRLLKVKNDHVPQDQGWYGFNSYEYPTDLQNIISEFRDIGVYVNQVIFISFPPTDLSSTDLNDSRTIFIHVDRQDDEEHLKKDVAPTRFIPKYVLNIPLVNCEKSETYFYEFIDPEKEISSSHIWGGGCVDYSNIKKVDQLILDKPAFLKVDVPHAVHNPTKDLRMVCSMRVDDSSPVLKEMFK